MMLPIFGPSTLRDTLGKSVHSEVSPVTWLARREGAEISIVYGIDARARALSAEAFLADAADEYALVRDGYLQYRKCQIVDCSTELPEYLSPDYDFEIPDFESIRSE
jgi:phospholipid-binding lipoprotein MlaA